MTDYSSLLRDDGYVVFLFHGVIPEQRHTVRNYTAKHLEAARFIEVIDDLKAAGTCVGMQEVVEASRGGGTLPPHAFAITFDDGFANNLTVAAPLLAARGLPATFYVTTGFLDGKSRSWIDAIEEAFEVRPVVELRDLLPGAPRRAVTRLEKIALLEEIRRVVKGDRARDPYRFAEEVRKQLGCGPCDEDPYLDRKLTCPEIRTLASLPGMTVGGHGHTHRMLEHLDDRDLDEEIATSFGILSSLLGRPIEHYSYPEGLPGCDAEPVVARLKAKGIACCPTAQPGANRVGDDLFRLRRVMVT